jgi:CubicO group peptidase (beta-lactamase class C family)
VVREQVAGWPAGAAAVGVVSPDGDVTVGPVDLALPWASVTKPVTALAVLVAVEEGTLRLDDTVPPDLLGAGSLPPAGVTVAHLLAHASGMAAEAPVLLDPPGTVRRYSNTGFRVVGELLARRSGLSVGTYLTEAVLEPLGMGGTRLEGGPDAGLVGPLRDLLALVHELARPRLVAAATHRTMTATAFPGLAGVLPGYGRYDPCPWGLGVEIRGPKQPHWTGTTNAPATFGHFGRAGSFVWIDPVAGVAAAGVADRPFGPWAQRAWPALADAVLTAARSADPVPPTP